MLFEGPANTGKTRALLEKNLLFASTFPNLRILWVRKTRKSLSESVLVTWEEHVLPPHHPCIVGTASRGNRDFYEFKNGTHIVLGGMDNPDRIMSTEYDLICYFEATEGKEDEWEKLSTRARNKRIKVGTRPDGRPRFFHQMVADCNPGTAFHWLNRRAKDGQMRRIQTRHADNPTFDDDDQTALDNLTGVRRRRLRDGEWVATAGQIWETWDPATMMCFRNDLLWDKEEPEAGLICDWYFGSIDWGFRNAGVLQVWGCDKDQRIFMVGEVYAKKRGIDWWAGALEHCIDKWELEVVVADPSRPDLIEYMNDSCGQLGGREENRLVIPADNDVESGLLLVREMMEQKKLMLCHDALELDVCKTLKEEYKATCTEQEIGAYTWKETKDGQYDEEKPDKTCDDHGCDAMRYAAKFRWGRDLTPYHKDRMFKPGTLGAVMDHEGVWEKIYSRRDGLEDEDEGY